MLESDIGPVLANEQVIVGRGTALRRADREAVNTTSEITPRRELQEASTTTAGAG